VTLSTISVNDMHCAGCVSKIERALRELEGVLETYINPARRQVLVEHADGTDTATLLAQIEQAGFHPCLTSNPRQSFRQRDLLKRLGIAGLAMMQVMMAALAMYAGAFDGINIKLMKCGGLGEALRMIHVARAHGMKIMLGCMVESSLAVTAAAHIAPLVDFADLDGNLLITNDPFIGAEVREGKLVLPSEPGLGVRDRS